MLTTVKGIYNNGKITLAEDPLLKEEKVDVIVTFLPKQTHANVKNKRTLGGLEGKIIVPENFNESLDDLKDFM